MHKTSVRNRKSTVSELEKTPYFRFDSAESNNSVPGLLLLLSAMLQRSLLSRTALRCRSGASLRRGFQLQADVPEGAPPIRGLDVISNRIANIVINITEKRPTNILHVYPENSVVTYLGKVSSFALFSLQLFC